jgi:hypothetical protein
LQVPELLRQRLSLERRQGYGRFPASGVGKPIKDITDERQAAAPLIIEAD